MNVVRKLRRNFQRIFARAKLPTSPAVASRILALMKDTNSSATDFGNVIRADPALAARLLKTANCALYAQRKPVTTIDRAVTVLGIERVKTLSLGFQLVKHLDRLGDAPFDMPEFWQQSLLRACLARSIAEVAVHERTEEAFLAGLLQECGVLLLVQVLDPSYGLLYSSCLSPGAFYSAERETYAYTHLDAIGAMAEEWQLPEEIAMPLRRHHYRVHLDDDPDEREKLVAVSYFVGSLCFDSNSGVATGDAEIRDFGEQALGLDPPTWDRIHKQTEQEYKAIATLYSEMLPRGFDISALLREANHYLSLSAEESAEKTVDLAAVQQALAQARAEAASVPADAPEAPDSTINVTPAEPANPGNEADPGADPLQATPDADARVSAAGERSGPKRRKPCTVHFFTGQGSQIGSATAVTRLIATDRVGLLTGQAFARGEAVEIALATGPHGLFLAGPVMSCSPAGPRPAYEIVVQLALRSKAALISGDPERFLREHDWAADALRRKQGDTLVTGTPA